MKAVAKKQAAREPVAVRADAKAAKAAGGKPADRKTAAKKPAAKRPAAAKPGRIAAEPTVMKSVAKADNGDAAVGKPAARKPAAKKPAAEKAAPAEAEKVGPDERAEPEEKGAATKPVAEMPVDVASSDLPPGWRSAEQEEGWDDPYAAGRTRSLILRAAAVVVVVAAVIGLLVGTAAGRYARGVDALDQKAYSTAVLEFSMARVLVFPYRDAPSLGDQAQRALDAQRALLQQDRARRDAVVAGLRLAGTRLGAGEANGVLAAVQAIRQEDLTAVLGSSDAARASAGKLATDLEAAAQAALGDAEWGRAGSYAAALLVLEPSSEVAVALGARAEKGQELSALLAEARDAASRGHWRLALRKALAVVAIRKDFPGAASLVAHARAALAPKPKPSPTRAATAPAPAPQPTPAPSSPPQPPPP